MPNSYGVKRAGENESSHTDLIILTLKQFVKGN
jgi:hypothetical protein